MKKILFALFALFAVATTSHAQKLLDIYYNGKVVYSVMTVNVDSMVISSDNEVHALDFYSRGKSFYHTLSADVDSIKVRECFVDLGLPSGTLWATCNIGANSPEEYGDYFAWGETEGYESGKTEFSLSNYKWCNGKYNSQTKYNTKSSYGIVDNKTELDLEDDVANLYWGTDWRIPSYEQFRELIKSGFTTALWTAQNGVYGLKITSKKNGNSIFLPAAGNRDNGSSYLLDSDGCYWSRTLNSDLPSNAMYMAFGLDFTRSLYIGIYYDSRHRGQSIRPVRISN